MTSLSGQTLPAVDASLVVDWVTPGIDPELPTRLLAATWQRHNERLVAPGLLLQETLNALLSGIRRRRWSAAEADTGASLLEKLPIEIIDTEADRRRAWELARRYENWPIYDMVYVALAERLGQPLVTADRRLVGRLGHLDWILTPEDVLSGS